jgi:hypothetical protein
MSRVNYFLLCESFLKDNSGKVSLINLYDVINSLEFPTMATNFVIALSVNLDKEEIAKGSVKIKVDIEDKTRKKLYLSSSGAGKLASKSKNVVTQLDLSRKLVFKNPGKYCAKLYVNDDQLAEFEFSVIKTPVEGVRK